MRKTLETEISLELKLEGTGRFQGSTQIGFLDHMLALWSFHGGMDLTLRAAGDLEVDNHHLVEDLGICLGQALQKALGNKEGIRRYGSSFIPMDEALVHAVVDLGGRALLIYKIQFLKSFLGDLETELFEEFWRAFVSNTKCVLHLRMLEGRNGHHIAEAMFKAVGRALREAVSIDPHTSGIPSTKGVLV